VCGVNSGKSPLREVSVLKKKVFFIVYYFNNAFICKQSEKLNHLRSEDVWERIKSTNSSSLLPPYSVIALAVIDPRLGMPGIRTSIDAVVPEQQRKGTVYCICISYVCTSMYT
jgi:hypothetical protein